MRKSGSVGGYQPGRVHSTGGGTSAAPAAASRNSIYGPGSASKRPVTPSIVSANKKSRLSFRPIMENIKDPRPTNKEARDVYIRELVNFLVEYGYTHPLTHKQLMQPTKTEFTQIFEFLVCHIRPNFKVVEKLEDEEVISQMKLLRYPFIITKSYLKTVGAPHCWPSVIPILDWLRVNIITNLSSDFVQTVLFRTADDNFGQVGEKELLFDYTNLTYNLYMHNIDSHEDADRDLERCIVKDPQIEQDIESMLKENESYKLKFNSLQSNSRSLDSWKEELAGVISTNENLKRYMVKQEACLKHKKMQFDHFVDEASEKIARLEQLENERRVKMTLVTQQNKQGIDFSVLMTKFNKLRRHVATNEKDTLELDKDLQNMNEELLKHNEQVESYVTEYNRLRRELLPEREDLDMKPVMTEDESHQIKLLMIHLHEFTSQIDVEIENLDEALTKDKSKEDHWKEVTQDLKLKKSSLTNTSTMLDENMEMQKEGHQRKVQAALGQAELKKRQHAVLPSEIMEHEKSLSEKLSEFQRWEEVQQVEEDDGLNFLEIAIEVMMSHKETVLKKFQNTVDKMKKWAATIEEM